MTKVLVTKYGSLLRVKILETPWVLFTLFQEVFSLSNAINMYPGKSGRCIDTNCLLLYFVTSARGKNVSNPC